MKKQNELNRFISAQQWHYRSALKEIQNGRKSSQWMWFIFPQIRGLGRSEMDWYYAIQDIDEAKRYMENDILRDNILEISEALIALPSSDAKLIIGLLDELKLRSSMTLFAVVTPEYAVFQEVLDKFFRGEKDPKTIEILRKMIC